MVDAALTQAQLGWKRAEFPGHRPALAGVIGRNNEGCLTTLVILASKEKEKAIRSESKLRGRKEGKKTEKKRSSSYE